MCVCLSVREFRKDALEKKEPKKKHNSNNVRRSVVNGLVPSTLSSLDVQEFLAETRLLASINDRKKKTD